MSHQYTATTITYLALRATTHLPIPHYIHIASISDDFEDLLEAIDEAARDDRPAAIADLEEAIASATSTPEKLSETPRELLLEARVILIRLYLAEGKQALANEAMDELIFVDPRGQAPVTAFGPDVADLHADRARALEEAGLATLLFYCAVDCEVLLDEHSVSSDDDQELAFGTHQIWIRARDKPAPWKHYEVTFDDKIQKHLISYADPSPDPPPEQNPEDGSPRTPKRITHRSVELVVLGLGVAVITTGATLLALDGRCSNTRKKPTDTTTKSECGQIYDIPPALGGAFTAIGGGLFVVSGVLLTVDEVRVAGKRGHQVMAGVTLRF